MRNKVRVILAPSSMDTVIEIDGVDITSAVQGVTISHEPHELPRVTLRCFLDEHRMEYEGPAIVARELLAGLPLVAEVELADRIERHRRELERMTDRPVMIVDEPGQRSIGEPAFIDFVQECLDAAGPAVLRGAAFVAEGIIAAIARLRTAIVSDVGLQLSAGILGAIALLLFIWTWESRSFLIGIIGAGFGTAAGLALGVWIHRGIQGER